MEQKLEELQRLITEQDALINDIAELLKEFAESQAKIIEELTRERKG